MNPQKLTDKERKTIRNQFITTVLVGCIIFLFLWAIGVI